MTNEGGHAPWCVPALVRSAAGSFTSGPGCGSAGAAEQESEQPDHQDLLLPHLRPTADRAHLEAVRERFEQWTAGQRRLADPEHDHP
ncbi:hypothetical protein, partial [Kitasatospora aureofaciens]|uniref:hypothetical protein n=1 Tax=Kitasatospora aureofaciens TaxID=1894 RepID=UPI001F15C387